jgi:hypothetical protein
MAIGHMATTTPDIVYVGVIDIISAVVGVTGIAFAGNSGDTIP